MTPLNTADLVYLTGECPDAEPAPSAHDDVAYQDVTVVEIQGVS